MSKEQYIQSNDEAKGVNESRSYYVTAFADKIAKWAQITPDSVVVDVPCGTGNMAQAIHEKGLGAKYYMVDINASMIDAAKEAMPGNQHVFIESDAARIASVIDEDSTDAVMCLNGLHIYIDDKEAFINGCFKILHTQGRLVVDVSTMGLGHPSRQYLDRHDELMREMAAAQGSTTDFPIYPDEATFENYASLITKAGFKLVDTVYEEEIIPIAKFNHSMELIPGRLRPRIPDLPDDASRLKIFLDASKQAQEELGMDSVKHTRVFFVAEKPAV
jgi:ubiquinone/menaquinone biosynthesis C-methylase UbiE